MMLDGSDGSILIDATLLTPDDGWDSKRQTMVVDAQDMVHIIWSDFRVNEDDYIPELFYTKLDPSLDDQDGDAADEPTITSIDDTMLTTDDEEKSRAPQSAIQCGRYIHITWYDDRLGGTDVFYMVLDTDGNIEVPETALTTNGSVTYSTYHFDNQPSLDVDSNGKAHTTWCDDRTGYYEVWYTSYQGPPCVPAAVPALTPIGLIALIGLLSVIAAISISTSIRKKRL